MSEANKLAVSRIYEAIWNREKPAVVLDHFASDYLGHSTIEVQGAEGVIQWATNMLKALGDGVFSIQDQIAEGDKVVTRWVASARYLDDCAELSANEITVRTTGIDIFRIANGKIIEGWIHTNRLVMGIDSSWPQIRRIIHA